MTETCYTYCNLTDTKPVYLCEMCREESASFEHWNGYLWRGICSTCGRKVIEIEGYGHNIRPMKLEAK